MPESRPASAAAATELEGAQAEAAEAEIAAPAARAGHVNRVGRNTAAGTIGKIVTMVLGFAVTPLLLSKLGATQFGLYAIVISLQSYFGLLDLGIGSGLSRFMIMHEAEGDDVAVRRVTAFGVLYYVVLGAALFPAVYLLTPLCVGWLKTPPGLVGQATAAIYYLFVLFMVSSATGVVGARLYAANRMDLSTLSNVASTALFVVSVLVVVPLFPNLLAALACSAVPVVSGAVFNVVLLRRIGIGRLLANPLRLSRKSMRSLFSFGVWSQVNSVTSVINLEADKLVIGRVLGTATVTPYQVGNRYALLSRALPLTLLGALYPDVTARLARGLAGEDFAVFYRDALRALMLATLTVVGFLIAVAPSFIVAWIGQPTPGAQAIAVALLLSYAVNNLTGVGTTVVRAQGRPEIETLYAVVSAVLNVGATVVLTPRFGLWGVVGGTIIGNVVGSLGFVALFHIRERLPLGATVLSWLVPLIVGVAVAGAATWGLNAVLDQVAIPGGRWSRMTVVAATGAVYLMVLALSLWALRFWKRADFAAVDAVRSRLSRAS